MTHTVPIQLTERCGEENLSHEGELVLHCTSSLPQIHGFTDSAQRRMNRYYQRLDHYFQLNCQKRLLPLAAKAAEQAHTNALPFQPFEIELFCQTTYLSDRFWSVSRTLRISCRTRPLLFRWTGEVWDLNTGLPCSLQRFFPGKQKRRTRLLYQARKAAKAQKCRGPGCRGRRGCFLLAENELHYFWPKIQKTKHKGDFFHFSFPYSTEKQEIC